MNGTSEDSVSMLAAVMWFIASLSIVFMSYTLQENSIEAVIVSAEHEERRLSPIIEMASEESYTGAQVIQTLYQINEIEADIQVNNTQFSKLIDIKSTDVSSIDPYKVYIVTFQRNTEGMLEKIIFRG